MNKATKIKRAIKEINKKDEAGCIIVSPRVYPEIHHLILKNTISGREFIFDLPIICENIKEDCLIISKDTLKQLGELYGK